MRQVDIKEGFINRKKGGIENCIYYMNTTYIKCFTKICTGNS